ncbi:MAG TPA: ATP-binding protein, partial [Tahibacter sp.]|nr:ATP-binding protein [Tahibacter sp.]
PGVGADDLPRLFERLFRVEGLRNRAAGGAGLGLAICRAIVDAHDGTIAASASPLGGLRVEVVLPLARSDA